jgi:hypothetical protein
MKPCAIVIPISFDITAVEVSVSASDVLRHGHGICFAKSHLLAAVLRTCGIAAGLACQKLGGDGRTYLHGLNAVWLADQGRWLDARGDKPGVVAKFSVAEEHLALPIVAERGERSFAEIHAWPLSSTLAALGNSSTTAYLLRRLPADRSALGRRQAVTAHVRFLDLSQT